jgi:hypothetical protein
MSTVHCCFQPNAPFSADIMSKMLQASDYWKPDAAGQAGNRDNTCRLAKANLFNTALSKKDFVYTDSQTGSMITANARLDNRAAIEPESRNNNRRGIDFTCVSAMGQRVPEIFIG